MRDTPRPQPAIFRQPPDVGTVLVLDLGPECDPKPGLTTLQKEVAQGDLPHGSIGYQTIFAAGLTLFLLTLLFNIIGHLLRKRYREIY